MSKEEQPSILLCSTRETETERTMTGLTSGTNWRWIGYLQRCPNLPYERVATLATRVVAKVIKVQSPEHGSCQTSVDDVLSLEQYTDDVTRLSEGTVRVLNMDAQSKNSGTWTAKAF